MFGFYPLIAFTKILQMHEISDLWHFDNYNKFNITT
jgi:hypothetical protein